jgi:hypothetical protein
MAATILPVPHIPQRKQGECLAACAAMMLNYLDHDAPIRVPRSEFDLAWLEKDEVYAVLIS